MIKQFGLTLYHLTKMVLLAIIAIPMLITYPLWGKSEREKKYGKQIK